LEYQKREDNEAIVMFEVTMAETFPNECIHKTTDWGSS
jgi:hypothetical protein